MMAGIVEFIKQMSVFLIMAKLILHLRPKQEYEKYLKMVVGIMILAMLVEKGTELLQGSSGLLWEENMMQWERILSGTY